MNAVNESWSRHLPYVLLALRVVAAVLFFQHGAQKLWGFTGSSAVTVDELLTTQRGIAGLLETIGPALLAAGFLTRFTAFILCGEMAVAYFQSWAPRSVWPITNGGEEAVAFCYLFLWMVFTGPGAWSVDGWLERRRLAAGRRPTPLKTWLATWEPQARSVLRVVVGFLIVQHGARKALGLLTVVVGGRTGVPPLAIDGLPAWTGYVDLAAGALLMVGLFTRPAAFVVAIELLAAYVMVAAPRGPWPIRNGGGEALIEAGILAVFVICGAGAWALDRMRRPMLEPEPPTATGRSTV